MVWDGKFAFGEAFAVYVGAPDENDLHEHAAYQIVLGHDEDVSIVDENGVTHRGSAFIIRPMTPHALQDGGNLTIVYLDPQASQALKLAEHLDAEDLAVLDVSRLPFEFPSDPEDLINAFQGVTSASADTLDPRLAAALSRLREEPGHVSITQAAAHSGISESRLRVLVRQQFGVPLSTWLIWRKLEAAAKALARGETLAEAAYSGGFADQAHFSRAMRRMLGITPNTAAKSLTTSSREGDQR